MMFKTECNTCAACNSQITDDNLAYCPNCNWELIRIPKTASEGLKNYYNDKLNRHKKSINNTMINVNELKAQTQLLETQKEEFENNSKKLEIELEKTRKKLETVSKENGKAQQLMDEIGDLKGRNNELSKEIKLLKTDRTNKKI